MAARGASEQVWWGDWFSLPSAISDPEGAYFARIVFWLDLDRNFILAQRLLQPGDDPIQVLYQLLLDEMSDMPLASTLMIRRDEAAEAFAAMIGDNLPIRTMTSDEPGPTINLREAFSQQAGL